jgi:hypothetical protein
LIRKQTTPSCQAHDFRDVYGERAFGCQAYLHAVFQVSLYFPLAIESDAAQTRLYRYRPARFDAPDLYHADRHDEPWREGDVDHQVSVFGFGQPEVQAVTCMARDGIQ